MLRTTARVTGLLWHGLAGEDGAAYQVEGAPCRVEIERSDRDEVAIHAYQAGSDTPDASIYMPDDQAMRLLPLLGWAIVDDAH